MLGHQGSESKFEEAVEVINQGLISVVDCMKVNTVKLNPGKAKVLLVSQKASQAALDRVNSP